MTPDQEPEYTSTVGCVNRIAQGNLPCDRPLMSQLGSIADVAGFRSPISRGLAGDYLVGGERFAKSQLIVSCFIVV